MVKRVAQSKLTELARYFKAVAVVGPRQSGKTTLVKNVFKNKPYVSLENMDTRRFASSDPRGFLSTYKDGAIFDEVQRVPELFSYLQEVLDNTKEKGTFILTGSNNFLLQEGITQSLAGRIGYLTLLPFSLEEISQETDDELLFKGFYPPIYDQKIPATDWFDNYIRTYIERDVRQLKAISDLLLYERFVRLLAGRVAQEINYTSIAVEAGIDAKTVQSWLSVLESSFIIYRLKPYYNNFNKTIVKRPKLYFYDTGLVNALLGIREKEQLSFHPLRGALFENMVVGEWTKQLANIGVTEVSYFWRDKTGREIDFIIDYKGKSIPIEIKSGQTVKKDFYKHLKYWQKLTGETKAYVVYAGKNREEHSDNIVVENWRKIKITDI